MYKLRYRQVHLDFHTSEAIPTIGERFNKEQFQAALKAAHVDSITVFSKCHHGWAYHPSKANVMHPGLKFDLLGAQLEACKEIGVKAPVYLSAGLDYKYAIEHDNHIVKGTPGSGQNFLEDGGFRRLCFNTPYLDTLIAQIEEVMQLYNPCGIFLDIVAPCRCYCQSCLKSMRELGLDPHNIEDVDKHKEIVAIKYRKRVEEAVRKYNPDTTIFHNAGHIAPGNRVMTNFNSHHLELESLPTGGWGYDHFPMSAAYVRTLEDKPFLGMTGKFHTSWGEFGGFKHPNALRYEAALSNAQGAKCSIGDQLHPSGEMNMSTYNLIGKAYEEVEVKEPYLDDVKHIVDVAIYSSSAVAADLARGKLAETGASRILLEGKYLYNIIDQYEEDFTPYKLIILPDEIKIDAELKAKLDKFMAAGGKLLCSGSSGLCKDKDEFAIDLGVKYEGVNEFRPNYMIPEYEALNGTTAYVMYTDAKNITITNGKSVALVEDPYFNRTPEHFCSHRHTPNEIGKNRSAACLTENTAYIAWNIFSDYAEYGEYHVKELVTYMIEALIGDARSATTNLPDRGVLTYTHQAANNRYIAHLLFAHTTKRGKDIEIIEDIIPLYGIKLEAVVSGAPKRVYRVDVEGSNLTETDLEFTYENGKAKINVDKVNMHAMVVIDM